jgi:hypothetical protein
VKLLALVLALALSAMVLAALAHAATFEFDFSTNASFPDQPPCNYIGPVSRGGITAIFGEFFGYSHSFADPATYRICPPSGAYAGRWSQQRENDGIFRNAPSGYWAGRMSLACVSDDEQLWYAITFNPPIRYFSCWITGTVEADIWACPPWVFSLDGGAHWNTHIKGATGTGALGPQTEIDMNGITFPTARTYPELVSGWVGCGPEYPDQTSPAGEFHWDNTLTPMCQWQKLEVVSPTPVSIVAFKGWAAAGVNWPVFIDDVVASTGECPHPPCEFERVSRPRDESEGAQANAVPGLPGNGQAITLSVLARRAGATDTRHSTWGELKLRYRP